MRSLQIFPERLAGMEVGYISTHLLRDDSNRKPLAETKFLGFLKIGDTVYIPYYVESADDWILQRFKGDAVFIPLNSLGVLQMQFLKNSRNTVRFVKMLDYDAVSLPAYSLFHCEKPNGTPIYTACDGNMSKLKRALHQAEKAGYKFKPNIFALNKEQEDFIVNYIEKTMGEYYVCHSLTERIVKNKLFENLDTLIQRQAVEKDGVTFPLKALK